MAKITLLIEFACSTNLAFSQLKFELRPYGIVIPPITNVQLQALPQSATPYSIPSWINSKCYGGTSWVTFPGAGFQIAWKMAMSMSS